MCYHGQTVDDKSKRRLFDKSAVLPGWKDKGCVVLYKFDVIPSRRGFYYDATFLSRGIATWCVKVFLSTSDQRAVGFLFSQNISLVLDVAYRLALSVRSCALCAVGCYALNRTPLWFQSLASLVMLIQIILLHFFRPASAEVKRSERAKLWPVIVLFSPNRSLKVFSRFFISVCCILCIWLDTDKLSWILNVGFYVLPSLGNTEQSYWTILNSET